MFACSATITYTDADGWTHSRSTPTFYLDERAQGIIDEDHARKIALIVVDPTATFPASQITVTAVKL